MSTETKRKRHAGQFKEGNPGGPGRPPLTEPVLDPDVPVELAVMRAAMAWEHDKFPKHSQVRVAVRAKKEDAQRFLADWRKMEKEYRELMESRARSVGGGGLDSEGEVADESSDKLEALALQVLARVREKAKQIIEGKS